MDFKFRQAELLFVLLIHAYLQSTSTRKTGQRLARLYPNYEQEKEGCNYEDYNPYNTATVSSMGHICARLQTYTLQSIYIHEKFSIGLGVVESSQEVMDASNNIPLPDNNLINTPQLQKHLKWLKVLKATATVMSPVLGILAATFGAVQAVKTPTHHDILGATNKALHRITNEVDMKMREAKRQLNDVVNMMEKDVIKRKYEFLFTYWTECVKLETDEETGLCQRESYRLIVGSSNEFLLFNDQLDTTTRQFSQLDDNKRRRIELGMVSFRNYAMLTLLCLKTLAMSYDTLRQRESNSNNTQYQPVNSCAEMKVLMIKKKTDVLNNVSKKLHYYCFFEEELITQARLFETYGKASIKEIKAVVASRLDLEIPTFQYDDIDHATEQHKKRIKKYTLKIWSRTVGCRAKLQSFKTVPCSYKVTLAEQPYHPENLLRMGNIGSYLRSFLKRLGENWWMHYEMTGGLQDGELISGNTTNMESKSDSAPSETSDWCSERIKQRRQEYIAMAHSDVERYWANEVMSTIICARILAEKMATDCESHTIRKFLPLADERYIKFKEKKTTTGDNPDRAIDGLLSSMSISRQKTNPNWMGELDVPTEISQIYIYIAESKVPKSFKFVDATVTGATIYSYAGVWHTFTGSIEVHRWWNWHFIFTFVYKRYRYLVETDNVGNPVASGYVWDSVEQTKWMMYGWSSKTDGIPSADKMWTITVSGFKGSPPGNFKRLKVETAEPRSSGSSFPTQWNPCTVQDNLVLPRLNPPLKVSCDNSTGRSGFIKLTVDDTGPMDFLLAEVRVYGYPEEADILHEPKEMAVRLKTAKQSTTANSTTTTAESAIDGSIATIAETQEQAAGSPTWLEVQMEDKVAVTAVNVQLVGEYENVTVQLSPGSGKPPIRCGADKTDVDGYDSRGIEWTCGKNTTPVDVVRVTAVSKSDNGKSTLKIREISIRAPYDESQLGAESEETENPTFESLMVVNTTTTPPPSKG